MVKFIKFHFICIFILLVLILTPPQCYFLALGLNNQLDELITFWFQHQVNLVGAALALYIVINTINLIFNKGNTIIIQILLLCLILWSIMLLMILT